MMIIEKIKKISILEKKNPSNIILKQILIFMLVVWAFTAKSQQLEPRSLSNIPLGTHFVLLNYSYSQGNVLFDPALTLDDVNAKVNTLLGAYVRSFNFFGNGAKFNVILPYVNGDWKGNYQGVDTATTRSGLADLRFGVSINFLGSPALKREEFSSFQQKIISGISFQVVAPTGQYDPEKLINLGSNRWAFKSQIGFSQKINSWYLEFAANIWLFTRNHSFWGGNTLDQKPIGTFKIHIIKTLKKRIWIALGAGYAFGGTSSINEIEKDSRISTLRLGLITTIPLYKTHSIKFMIISAQRFEQGADFDSFSIAYQYLWNRKK